MSVLQACYRQLLRQKNVVYNV